MPADEISEKKVEEKKVIKEWMIQGELNYIGGKEIFMNWQDFIAIRGY